MLVLGAMIEVEGKETPSVFTSTSWLEVGPSDDNMRRPLHSIESTQVPLCEISWHKLQTLNLCFAKYVILELA